jgi:phosphoglucomutase
VLLVAWLNIIAAANKGNTGKTIGINDILLSHYKTYGRSFFSRYDYEEVSSEGAKKLVDNLNKHLDQQSLQNQSYDASNGESYKVANLTNFSYTDPIDGSVSKNQGHIILFSDGSRVVFRLSGTGSQGATVRLYVERYTKDETQYSKETAEGLKGLIEVALRISKLTEYLEREEPTVITVSKRIHC